jgi:hypothetical protein
MYTAQLFRLFDHVQTLLRRAALTSDADLPKKDTVLLSCCRTLALLLQLEVARDRPLTDSTLQLLAELLLFRAKKEHVTRRESQLLICITQLLSRHLEHHVTFTLSAEHVIFCLDLLAHDSITWAVSEIFR